MARLVLVVTALAGCNSIWGNDRVLARDAQYFDVPADSPFACPAPGSPPPVFNPALHGVIIQNCNDYSFNAGRASATCFDAEGLMQPFEGPVDQPLSIVTPFVVGTTSGAVDEVRLSSDGNTLYARFVDFVSFQETRVAIRQGDSWILTASAPFGANLNDSLSTIAHGSTGDHVIVRASDATLHEWVQGASGWQELQVHTVAALGRAVGQVKLSHDGLHLTAASPEGIFYSDRPSIDAPFRAFEPFPSAPLDFNAPLITDDCARLYVAGIGEVFYAQQR